MTTKTKPTIAELEKILASGEPIDIKPNGEVGQLDENSFEAQLRKLLNTWSLESRSDTPDFVLAKYMADCLDAFSSAVRKRDHWYGFKPFDANAPTNEPRSSLTKGGGQ